VTERSAVTTHVLDTARGVPAEGIVVRLERVVPADPDRPASPDRPAGPAGPARLVGTTEVGRGRTDSDGRIGVIGPGALPPGRYRLIFETGDYLGTAYPGESAFFPEVVVTFTVDDRRPRYHVPLLLSPYSYSTYLGS